MTTVANPIQQHFLQSFNSVYVCGRSRRHVGGEVPPVLLQTCGAYLQGILYIFGGCDNNDYTNLVRCFRIDNIIIQLNLQVHSQRQITGFVQDVFNTYVAFNVLLSLIFSSELWEQTLHI